MVVPGTRNFIPCPLGGNGAFWETKRAVRREWPLGWAYRRGVPVLSTTPCEGLVGGRRLAALFVVFVFVFVLVGRL